MREAKGKVFVVNLLTRPEQFPFVPEGIEGLYYLCRKNLNFAA
jgi:hypothetical protein